MNTARGSRKLNVRFVELLEVLTRAGRAEWIQSKGDPGFVFCLLDQEDVVKFECMGGKKGDEHVAPDENLAGVVAHHSNTTYLWLPRLPSWDTLLRLLRSSRGRAARWRACKRLAYEAPVKALETRLKQ